MKQNGLAITYQDIILKNIEENQFAQPKLFRNADERRIDSKKSHNELIEKYIIPNSVIEGSLDSFEL